MPVFPTSRVAAVVTAALFLTLAACARDDSPPVSPALQDEEIPVYTFSVDPSLLQEEEILPGGIALRVPRGWIVQEPGSPLFQQFQPAGAEGFELDLLALSDEGAAMIAGTYREDVSPEAVASRVTEDPGSRDHFRHEGLEFHQARVMTEEAVLFVLATATPAGTVMIQFVLATEAVQEQTMRQVESAIGSIRPLN
ncbi:MAG: hypothetical protein EA427_11750 [Spirochaetaceae bacterium]|nr:MAG: hypothetical protein EA427_11750 [Spirochaetaceae bacterium]